MRLIFGGTPAFAATALAALAAEKFEIAMVLTQPDRPAGRGMQSRPSAVKQLALSLNLPVFQPATLKNPEVHQALRALEPEAMVVAAYGLLLPPPVLEIPARGCINIHASLLPRWRGAAPIERAILAGDRETGITIMQMDAGLDTGAMLMQEKIAIADDDTAQTVHDKLAASGARLIVRTLRQQPVPRPQEESQATYARKISKAEAVIDWSRSALNICRQVRAFNPAPGANTTHEQTLLKIWRARPTEATGTTPGTVLRVGPEGIVVAAGEGAVDIQELQKAGGKKLGPAAFLAGNALVAGTRLGA